MSRCNSPDGYGRRSSFAKANGSAIGGAGLHRFDAYCFSGKMALRAAAVRPGKIAAAASFHGGGLYTDGPSPHLVLPKIRARLYFGHAINDRSMPQEAIEKLNQALENWGGKFESEVYPGAIHGWTVPDSHAYNPQQAERAFAKLRELFAGTLQ